MPTSASGTNNAQEDLAKYGAAVLPASTTTRMIKRFDGAPTCVVAVPQVLTMEQATEFRRVSELRATPGGPGNAAGNNGYALYNNPKTSNSGGEMDPTFRDWAHQQKMRADVPLTSMAHGGRFNRSPKQKKAGTFRDSFVYTGGHGDADAGVLALLHNPQFLEAARQIHPDRPVVEPGILFANLFIPGENQGIHTDTCEFRGCNRTNCPEWVPICMHHMGEVFEHWYVPIVTAISWFSDHQGGELVFYGGLDQPGTPHPTPFNTALVLDTDSIYHGVDPTGGHEFPPPRVPGDVLLQHKGNGRFCVRSEGSGQVLPMYEDLTWADIRMSVQWKAYCFKNEAERAAYHDHTDDITPAQAWKMMVAELQKRGLAKGDEPVQVLIEALCKTFYRVPQELQAPHQPEKSAMFAPIDPKARL